MKIPPTAQHSAQFMSQYALMTALLIAGLIFATPKAAAQLNSGPVVNPQGADASISCEETRPDPYAGCAARAGEDRQVPSFDLWCLEIQLYPALRCDAHINDDMQAYEHYRSLAEQFEQQRGAQEERDQEIMNLLNRDPLDHNQMDVAVAGRIKMKNSALAVFLVASLSMSPLNAAV